METSISISIQEVIRSATALFIITILLYMLVAFIGKKFSLTPESLIGWVFFAVFVVGIVSFFFGYLYSMHGNPIGGGICFLASAVSFGLLSNALLRK